MADKARATIRVQRRRKRSWPLLLAALLAWYERDKREDEERRVRASRYDLTKYEPRKRML